MVSGHEEVSVLPMLQTPPHLDVLASCRGVVPSGPVADFSVTESPN